MQTDTHIHTQVRQDSKVLVCHNKRQQARKNLTAAILEELSPEIILTRSVGDLAETTVAMKNRPVI